MFKKILVVTAIAVMGVGCATQPTNTPAKKVVANDSPAITREPASACMNGKPWQCKTARRNDPADQYMLDKNGNFYRYFKSSKQLCQVTSNVSDFKISQHPTDSAAVYYTTNENELFVVHSQGVSGNCPPVSKKSIMTDVKEYKVVSNTHSTIVNAALTNGGHFVAWGDVDALISQNDVVDFEMNNCFGSEGKSFNSYVLFTLDTNGDVRKVKVGESFSYVFDESSTQRGSWSRLSEWKDSVGGVCR
jgi:hypothetical protein